VERQADVDGLGDDVRVGAEVIVADQFGAALRRRARERNMMLPGAAQPSGKDAIGGVAMAAPITVH
jgi:hypothetical protein